MQPNYIELPEIPSDQEAEIRLWQDGRELAHIVNSEGWKIVLGLLQSYAEEATKELVTLKPGKTDEILAAHAVAFAADDLNYQFREAVKRMLTAAQTVPDIIRNLNQSISTE